MGLLKKSTNRKATMILYHDGGVIDMAYLEFKILSGKGVELEHYWLQDPTIYNQPGGRLFLLRVGCHNVTMCIPYKRSMDWDNVSRRAYSILRELGLRKEVIRIDVGKGVYLEDCIFMKTGTQGYMCKALVFTMKVKKPIPVKLLYCGSGGTVYHPELFGVGERLYPKR